MVRSIARSVLFRDDTDRNRFIDRAATVFTEGKAGCYAFALLSNHVHLLVRTGIVPLSTLMTRILTGYAVSFNKRHKRYGHLFQNRYKSILCEEDPYFNELVRYIHLKPLRARLIPDLNTLDSYPYSGHATLMGRYERSWLDTDYVLSRFGSKTLYRAFVEAGIKEGRRHDLTRANIKGDERILGSTRFVLEVMKSAGEAWEHTQRLKVEGVDFEAVLSHVEKQFGLDPGELLRPGKYPRRVAARSVLCYFLVRELHMTATAVAGRLGLGQPAVSIAVARGEALVREKGYSMADLMG